MHYVSFSPSREKLLSKASLASGRRIGYFLAAVGIILLGSGTYLFCKERSLLAHSQHATARLVEWQEKRTHFGLQYIPVFAYEDNTGRQWKIVSSRSTHAPIRALDQTAEVVYPTDNPGQGQLEDFFTRWGAALFLGIPGAVLAVVGYIGTGIFEWLERTSHAS